MSLQRNLDIVRTLTLAVLFSAISTVAYAGLDAPHNAVNTIGCLSCHDMLSSDPKHIPDMGNTVNTVDDTVMNFSCWKCHTGTVAPDPLFMDAHSSATTSINYGGWSVECWVCHNQHTRDQGATNPLIRKNINLSWILNPLVSADKTGVRTVSYTGVGDHVNGAGGGLCEICHTETKYYNNTGTGLAHNPGTDCLTCHTHDAGFVGGADHSTFIADDAQADDANVKCSGCHAGYDTSPETAHSDCSVCHTTAPALLDSSFPNGSAPDYDGASMFANLTNTPDPGYQTINSPRITDKNGLDITGVGFIKIKCGSCHAAKPQALTDGNHGGHAASHFAWNAATQTSCGAALCHDSATNTNVVNDIHVAVGGCTVCHDTAAGGDGTSKVGDATFGIDGSAEIIANGGPADPVTHTELCTDCHNIAVTGVNAGSIGGIHHWNRSTNPLNVVETDCASCHTVPLHEGTHGVAVADTTNCNTCHTATAGSLATGAVPINVGDNKVHDGCTSCHLIAPQAAADGQLKVVTAPGGSANIAAGNCNTCHDAYFASHTNANHTALTTVTPCLSCHTGDMITDVSTHNNNCADCHNLTTGARVDGAFNASSFQGTAVNVGDAAVNPNGGTCSDCHSPYFGTLAGGHIHGTNTGYASHNAFANSTDCLTCHGNGVAGTEAKEAIISPFIGATEVHGAFQCGTCHDLAGGAPTGALIGSAIGNSAAAGCIDCHINGGTKTWTTVHTAAIGTGTGTVDHALSNGTAVRVSSSTNCSGCHASVAGTDARDAVLSPYNGAGEVHETSTCATCHTGNNDGGFRADVVLTKANTIVAGDCEACHGTNGFDTIHTPSATVDHANRVNEAASCAACHTATAWDGVSAQPFSIPVDATASRTGDMVHDTCLVCHTAANGKVMQTPGAYTTTIVSGDCQTCHTAYNFDNHVHGTTGNYIQHVVTYDALIDISQVSNPAPCWNCHTPASGLNTWAGIVEEHDNTIVTCARCHSYIDDGNATPPQGTNDGAIGTRTAATCTICHTPKLSPAPSSDHGGHNTTDFDSTGTTCVNCHTDGGLGTVEGIHGNTCTTCHLTNSGGMGTTIVGANGWGSAQLSAQPPLADYRTGTCLTCHGDVYAYDTTFTNHAVQDHKTKLGADILTPSTPATCTVNCHDGTSLANILTNTHGNGTATTCTNCHTNITNDGSLRVGANSNGDASTHVIDTPSACSDCHSTYAADFTIHDVKDHTGVAGAATCTTTCHDGTTTANIITNTHYNTCTNCHSNTSTDGKLVAGTNGDATGGAGTCTACHGGTFAYDTTFATSHKVKDHKTKGLLDVLTATVSCTTNCHDASSLGAILTPLHLADCSNCHTNTLANGTLRAGVDGDATAHVFNTPSECATCHAAYATDYQAEHNVQDHTGIAAVTNCTTTCHTATTPATIVTTTHTNNCTNCHLNNNTDGRLVSGTNGDATSGTGDCAFCHSAHDINFSAHAVGDHKTKALADVLTATPSCTTNCHDASSLVLILTPLHLADCSNCHTNTAANGTLRGGADGNATAHVFNTPSECATCHAAYNTDYQAAHNVQDHTGIAGVANCTTTCHTDTTPATIVTGTHKNTCINCHLNNNTDGRLVSGTNGDATGGAGTCAVCHTAYNTNFGTAHAVGDHKTELLADVLTATATCTTNCHDGSSLALILNPLHSGALCTSCHTDAAANGTLRNATNGNAASHVIDTPSECASCHTAYAANFETAHDVKDHTGVTYTAQPKTPKQSDDCNDCHAPTTAALIISTTHNNTCTNCHTNTTTDGKLIAGATGDATGGSGECIFCHAVTYFSNTSQHTDGTSNAGVHTVAINGDTSAGQTCDTAGCHAGQSENWTNILARHDLSTTTPDVCQVCHDSTRTANTVAGSVQLEITENLGRAAITSCLECHSDRSAGHGGHDATHFTYTASCATCHTDLGNGLVIDIHGNTCTMCHLTASGGTGTTIVGANGDGNAQLGVSAAPHGAVECITCHDVADADVTPATIGGLHHNNTGSVAYDVNACTDCHTATSHTTYINDSTNACNTCHTLTQGTATGAPVASGDPKVHDACITCHEFVAAPSYQGTLVPPTNNKGVTVMKTNPANCVDCHTAPKKDMHHTSTLTTSGTCQACHVNSQTTGVGPAAPQQMACKECHVDETQNGLRIVSFRLANGDGTQPTGFENTNSAINGSLGAVVTDATGYVTAHDITHTSPIAINDYTSCFACHNGTYPNAAAVAPFHGFPGEAASAYIETGNGSYTNKTILGGGTVVLDEFSGSNNLLPLPFMYYHPGHNSFRRFGETGTMTRRSQTGGYAENGELYRNAGTYANAIRNNAFQATVIEDYLRKAGNNYPGGECTHGGGNAWNTGTNLDIVCTERKSGSNPYAGQAHETPVTGYALRIASIPYSNFSASDGNAPANTGYGMLNNIPYFTAVGAPNDRVFVNSAEVDASKNLIVVASNDEGCGLLTVTESGGGTNYGSMSLNATTGYCELTTAVGTVPAAIDVTSSGTGGTAVTNFPVVNNSSTPTTVTITSGPHSWTPTAVGIGDVTTVTATSADTLTGMWLNYNATNYAMTTSDGGLTWTYTLTGVPYAATVEAIANDASFSGQSGTKPVTDNGDVITVTSATYTSTTLDVALTTSQVNTSVSIDYNNDGATTPDLVMTDAGGGTSWTYSGTEAAYNSPITIYTSKFGQDTNVVVTNNNNNPPVITTPPGPMTVIVNSTGNTVDVISGVTDAENDNVRVSAASATCGTITTTIPTAWVAIGSPTLLSYDAPATTGNCTINYTISDATGSVAGTVAVTVNAAPTSMPGSDGTTVDGIFPGDNFATNGSATVNVSFLTANAGDKNNYWTLWDEAQNGTAFCTGSFSTSDGGSNYTATIDFSTCGAPAGQYFLEYAIEDNNTGAKFKIKYLPITLGTTTEYYKVFSDAAYTTETTSFNSTDMVYVEVNSAAVHGVLGGTCDGTQAAKMAGFDDTKYIDKLNFSSCTYQGGNVYRWSFDLSQQSISFPSGTYWYQGEMKPADSGGTNNIKVGMLLEITAP